MTQLGMMAADAGVGTILGIANDVRQGIQNKKLLKQQVNANKEMSDYQFKKQKEMWDATNYAAQKEHMIKAGLNPGLMYGMSGGGGVTTGSGGGGISGATATGSSNEAMGMVGMGIQTRLLKAQERLLNAQATNQEVEAAKKAGVDTEKVKAETTNLMQGYDNLRNDYDLQMLEKTMKNLEIHEKEGTVDEIIKQIETETQSALRRLQIVSNEAKESTETLDSKITTVKNIAIGSGLENILRKVGIKKGQEETRKITNEIQNMVEQNMRAWEELGDDKRRLQIQNELKNWETDLSRWGTEQIAGLIDNLIIISPKIPKEVKRNPIGFGNK